VLVPLRVAWCAACAHASAGACKTHDTACCGIIQEEVKEEPEKKKRKVKEVTPEWNLLNKQKPLW